MNITSSIGRSFQALCVLLVAVVLAFAPGAPAGAFVTANLLTDPGFESNPLVSFAGILGFPYTLNAWGAENGSIVTGPNNGVFPASGLRMHRMDDDGLLTTQSVQKVDVSAYSAAINAGQATAIGSALYNVPSDVLSALSSLNVGYYNAAHNPIGNLGIGFTVDANAATWQTVNGSGLVPAGTTYLLMHFAFSNATMVSQLGPDRPAFVDDARLVLSIVPEPSSMGLAAVAVGGVGMLRRRRR